MKLDPSHPLYRPVKRRFTMPADQLDLEKSVHAFVGSYDAGGNYVEAGKVPAPASANANYAYEENGITWLGFGRYYVESVENGRAALCLLDNLACSAHEWCTGHSVQEVERFERGEPVSEIHLGQVETLHEFTAGEGHRDGQASMQKVESQSLTDALAVLIEIDREYRMPQLADLAGELRALADKLDALAHGEAVN
ncbi:hypothetical protein [Ruicaihuangia caeni]|uniref:Peptidase S74 domain-containing protein n=1 Tax=Ruicaihuangia caeni TaxID=3042517 RepID=A0AAW6T2K0_9MICO|nr:hypothetical protein [Klugiella sp. YN-L-19]MDI2098002.1 hypothetical protein [Klugiella sp. YN-L-19]